MQSFFQVRNDPNKYKEDASPVMTRSATRKYASVGAIYNRVDFKHELKIMRNWPVSVCCPPPNLTLDSLQLKDIVTRSLNCVMSFCKYATLLTTDISQKKLKKRVDFNLEKSVNFIDLSPYISQEPTTEKEMHQTQITLHLNESVLSHQFINVISINNEEQSQALVIQEEDELETITLHSSGETYVLDNKKYISNSDSVFVNLSEFRASKTIQSVPSEDPMVAVYNDHTYAMRYTENVCVAESQSNEAQGSRKQEKSELFLQNALKDLLLNTAILNCLILGKTPQEMIELLDRVPSQ